MAAGLLLAASALNADPARAHAVLMASTPAVHALVPEGAVAVLLRFNSRIDALRSKLTIGADAPGSEQKRLVLAAGDKPEQLRSTVTLTAGPYVLHWQVLAVDGHITRGIVPFRVGATAH